MMHKFSLHRAANNQTHQDHVAQLTLGFQLWKKHVCHHLLNVVLQLLSSPDRTSFFVFSSGLPMGEDEGRVQDQL